MKTFALLMVVVLLSSCSFEIIDGEPETKKPIEIVTVKQTEPPASTPPSPTKVPEQAESSAPSSVAPKTEEPKTQKPKPTETPVPLTPVTSGDIDPAQTLALPDAINDPYPSKFGSPNTDDGKLSNEKLGWYFGINENHQPPTAQSKFDIRQFGGYYLGDTSQKELYLTFDEGYEYGFTPSILDTLKEKNVKACFFVTKPFVKSNLDLVLRMLDEGHVVGSHSVSHKSSPELGDEEFNNELLELAEYYFEQTGQEIACFFRPPMGEYSARTLKLTDDLGYKSIFWSFAYKDWEVDNQPGMEKAFNMTVTHMHNGSIVLLHAVSQSNTEALPYIIDCLKANGFTFKSLYDLPENN